MYYYQIKKEIFVMILDLNKPEEAIKVLKQMCFEGKVVRKHDARMLVNPRYYHMNGRLIYDFDIPGIVRNGKQETKDYFSDIFHKYVDINQ